MSDPTTNPFDERSEVRAEQLDAERAAARIEQVDRSLPQMLAQSMRRGDTVTFAGANGERIQGEIVAAGTDHVRIGHPTTAPDIHVQLVDYWIIHISPAAAGGRQTSSPHDSWTAVVRSFARDGSPVDCWLTDGSRVTGEIVGVNSPTTHAVLSTPHEGTTWVPLSMFVAVTQPPTDTTPPVH